MIAARYVAVYAESMARAKPRLRRPITDRLLDINSTHHPPERRNLIKGHAVEVFGKSVQDYEDQVRILEFARSKVDSTSPRTKNAAQALLKSWAESP